MAGGVLIQKGWDGETQTYVGGQETLIGGLFAASIAPYIAMAMIGSGIYDKCFRSKNSVLEINNGVKHTNDMFDTIVLDVEEEPESTDDEEEETDDDSFDSESEEGDEQSAFVELRY